MDNAKLTTKSQEALSQAVRRAAAGGNAQVEPVHLLLALLEQTDGTAVPLLEAAGADVASVCSSRASSRCTGSTWACPPAAARRTAWERASWLLVVSFALSIVVFSVISHAM